MQWIGGPSKDLGESKASGGMVAIGSTGSNAMQTATSQAAQRVASEKGAAGGGGGDEPDSNEKVGETASGGGAGNTATPDTDSNEDQSGQKPGQK